MEWGKDAGLCRYRRRRLPAGTYLRPPPEDRFAVPGSRIIATLLASAAPAWPTRHQAGKRRSMGMARPPVNSRRPSSLRRARRTNRAGTKNSENRVAPSRMAPVLVINPCYNKSLRWRRDPWEQRILNTQNNGICTVLREVLQRKFVDPRPKIWATEQSSSETTAMAE